MEVELERVRVKSPGWRKTVNSAIETFNSSDADQAELALERIDQLTRVDALSTNSRAIWFVVVPVCLVIAVAAMGVRDIDFYGVARSISIPLVNISVPSQFFFLTAPILITAVYGYLHLNLIRLWDALGAAPAQIDGRTLGDSVRPWLLTDAALMLRGLLRRDGSTAPRTMQFALMTLNFLISWVFAPQIIIFLWWESMTARSMTMTAVTGWCLLISLFVGSTSWVVMLHRMRGVLRYRLLSPLGRIVAGVLGAAVVFSVVFVSIERTSSIFGNKVFDLAAIELTDQTVVEKPADWLPYSIATAEFLSEWCARERVKDCTRLSQMQQKSFAEEWRIRRNITINALSKPNLGAIDFREVNLRGAFLAGINFKDSLMNRIDLSDAVLESAELSYAELSSAVLVNTSMESANLHGARLNYASLRGAQSFESDFREAQIMWADLSEANLEYSNFRGADLSETNLRNARLQGAYLAGVRLQNADLFRAQLSGASLRRAWLRGARLVGANMRDAELSFSLITGNRTEPSRLTGVNFAGSKNEGGALRFVDVREAEFDSNSDWRNVFLDGSVAVPPDFRESLNSPCQWSAEPLLDEEFFGRWRGWLNANPKLNMENPILGWRAIAPEEWHDVAPISPPEGCVWI